MQPATLNSLPEPDAASARHSAACARFIRDRIAAAGGRIAFAEFMHHALYAPGLGYYMAGRSKFGASGDYITAPECSPLFARVLARQVAAVLASGPRAQVLEFGAGSGQLAADLLQALASLDALPDAYRILEVSPDLADRQRERLTLAVPEFVDRVQWLSDLPAAINGVVIANEVLDALPVERFVRGADALRRIGVGAKGEGFELVEMPASPALTSAVLALEAALGGRLPDGYRAEICLAASDWVEQLAARLETGTAFLIDYGLDRHSYYAADRSGGWLRCHYRHRAHSDPLLLPGLQDITAWVDFSRVADAAVDAGLTVAGYVTQAHFLIDGGLDTELAAFEQLPLESQLKLAEQVRLLTMPGDMGEGIKCLLLSRGRHEFSLPVVRHDRTHTL